MKTKTNKKSQSKSKRKPPPSLDLEALKALAVRTGITAGEAFAYHCNHISDVS